MEPISSEHLARYGHHSLAHSDFSNLDVICTCEQFADEVVAHLVAADESDSQCAIAVRGRCLEWDGCLDTLKLNGSEPAGSASSAKADQGGASKRDVADRALLR